MAKKLTALTVKSNRLAPGRYGDGGGLYLLVRDGGARSWVFRYRERGTGKQRDTGLGSAGSGGVSLDDARERAGELRAGLRRGVDPAATKRAERAAGDGTFGTFADALLESIKPGFKNKSSGVDWKRDIEVRCASLRPKRCKDISTDDVLGVLKPLWLTKSRTARETRGRIERILDAAKAKGLRSGENPARWKGHLKELLPATKRKKRHHPAAPYKDVPRIVRALREKHAGADTAVNLAAEYVILTAVRTGEGRFMKVSEIDFKARLWTIPAARMKLPKDHEVPLCARAVAILKAVIPKDAKPDDWVFAGLKPGQPLGMNAVLHALKAVYPGITTHGCRSSFRDWAGDETSTPRDIAEMALAHAVGDEVEQAYRRGTALEKRRHLMEAWGRYVDGGSKLLRIVRAG
ncbi:integrase arm-type DNA-binding domain-containing protein [Bradyrhizobium sediminis]|uniref:Integrase arm-type DNA-binding domain-containing protein n=1 Tax=Bradyrhizobium sediminis TaxID=2840469 RepID=A0A975NN26_9BRAD|nr:site-specific integrase [Bradyrhizobium sediminis]QWG17855.1 integrase arm-type DNA-binding domain-containing protein [Bradyrhizobium sediminis]